MRAKTAESSKGIRVEVLRLTKPYDTTTKQLSSYKQRSVGGLELMGVRKCSFDFNDRIQEYPRSTSKTAVRNTKKLIKDLEGKQN